VPLLTSEEAVSSQAHTETIALSHFTDQNLTGLLVNVIAAGQTFQLMPDTGNNYVIFPYNAALAVETSDGKWEAQDASYTILDPDVRETWGHDALLMSGPVKLGTRQFNITFFMKKSKTDKHGNFGMNSLGNFWYYKRDEKGEYVSVTTKATEKHCPMLASGWKYFQILLIPSPDSSPQSKLILSDDGEAWNWMAFVSLLDTQVAQVSLASFRLSIDGKEITSDAPGMVAMIDSGGGAILASNPAAADIANENLKSNSNAAFTWPAPNKTEVGEVVWLKNVTSEFSFHGSDGYTHKFTIPGRDYTQVASIQHNRYLNGQNGFNIGAQFFQFHRVAFDVRGARIGIGLEQPP